MNDEELLKKLKLCFEDLFELECEGDIDQFEFSEILEKHGLVKSYEAPKDDDEHDYYQFPIWFGEQEVRNSMQIEWDQPTPAEVKP